MKDLIIVYDDSVKPNKEIRTITGGNSFGNTIFKRISLKQRIQDMLSELAVIRHFIYLSDEVKLQEAFVSFGLEDMKCPVIHLFADFGIIDRNEVKILLEKASYIHETFVVKTADQVSMIMFENVQSYFVKLKSLSDEKYHSLRELPGLSNDQVICSDAFWDLSVSSHFRQFITSGFEARYFNQIQGDDYTVTKRSDNRDKIKREYTYYQLLPENMKSWFVIPYQYTEDEKGASYQMERYHMTDIAIRYVHGAVSLEEFERILDKLFYFLTNRKEKEVTAEVYQKETDHLYLNKLFERMESLKQMDAYERINQWVSMGTDYQGLDEVVSKYTSLYHSIMEQKSFRKILVVGHGDLCFSNILYSDEISLMKLIDPRGALAEEELYINPYYDMAKLSHSICGNYDFLNSSLFEITVEEHMKLRLSLINAPSVDQYKLIFKKYLSKNEIDYKLIRLYEASLFLSMLPLHIDRERKVLAFILNAIQILEEIEAL
ncbi:MAG: hypothetical protein GX567_15995 [Clostridia bacterium]|nr:hypothetical protein [Clostridia bacterium]